MATDDDAEAVSTVYLRSRKELVACAPLAHSDDAVRAWIRERLIPPARRRSPSAAASSSG
jgi:hypothetical protein